MAREAGEDEMLRRGSSDLQREPKGEGSPEASSRLLCLLRISWQRGCRSFSYRRFLSNRHVTGIVLLVRSEIW